ncbi:hypothetical protein L0F63_007417 [Massospora cicadina]|nr:hypothetical protein L0F63_007417 [Massospora cicadina]
MSLKTLGSSSYKPFKPELDITENQETALSPYTHLANSQLLNLQRQTYEEQDRNLEMLSQSISRQREMGVTIGQELDHHVTLLDETDNAVDMMESRLNQEQARLLRINRKNKQCKLCGALVVVFIVLLIVLALIRLFHL